MTLEVLAIVLLAVVLAGFGVMTFVLNKKLGELRNDSGLNMLKSDMQGVSAQIAGTTREINDRLGQAANYMMAVQQELGRMQEIGQSMKELQNFIRSPKLRGTIGEQVLRDLLHQMIPGGNYRMQYAFRSGEKVDAIVKTKNGIIPIDAKFPMENYSKAVAADTKADRDRYLHEFAKDVRKHLHSIARKYILPGEGTVDFALMYVPSEAIYYEIICNTQLQSEAVSSKVYMVSPNTFYYFLQTIMLALEGEKVEERAKQIIRSLKGIQHEAKKFSTDLDLVSGHLNRAKNAMDHASTSYSRLGGKIELANGSSDLAEGVIPVRVGDGDV